MKDTTIHIVIPCYNAVRYIAEAISSVKNQTSDGWDCVIVDDGSTDGSGKMIDKDTDGDDRFRVIHTENRGVAAARNLAISQSNGGYVLPFDADDYLMPQAVESFAKAWREHPDASLIIPQIRRCERGRIGSVQERKWCGYEDLKTRCTPTNSSCFKWDDWKKTGGYRDGTMYEDWEFWLRLLYKNDSVINIPEVLVLYRVHPDSRWHKAVKRHNWEVENIMKMNPKIFGKCRK